MKYLSITVAGLLLAGSTLGDEPTSKALARQGTAAWVAFQCSALAMPAGEPEAEMARLFQYGYDQGRVFIENAAAGKIQAEDANAEVPIGFLWNLQGPSPDFMLGMIYKAAAGEALKNLYVSESGELLGDDKTRLVAHDRYRGASCGLVGR